MFLDRQGISHTGEMGLLSFFGGFFLSASPCLSVGVMQVSRSPRRVILAIGAAFAWLLGVFMASLLWFVIPPFRSALWAVVAGVLTQEGARFGFLWAFAKGEKGFVAVAPPDAEPQEHLGGNAFAGTREVELVETTTRRRSGGNSGDDNNDTIRAGDGSSGEDDDGIVPPGEGVRHRGWRPLEMRAPTVSLAQTGLAFGVGTGLAYVMVMYGTILSQAADGPAVFFSHTCPTYNGIGTSAFSAMLYSLLHIFWFIPAIHSFLRPNGAPRNRVGIAWVVVSHFVAALVTLPSAAPYGCVPAMLMLLVWTIVNAAAALFTVLPGMAPRILERPIELLLIGQS